MINIFISSFIGSVIVISNAYIFNFLFFKKKINQFNIYKDTILGFIFIGFISLLINFFFPINKIVSSIFFIFSLLLFFYLFLKFKKKKELILVILFLSVTTFIIIAFANINRPDAGLYHLPFIKILNENKIIIGLTNLHFRFGHTSILQYVSAIHVNHFFKAEFLNIPLAILPSVYFLFLFKEFLNQLKIENEKNTITIFLISAFSIYSFNRFSGLGNDGPANIFFFVLLIHLLNIQNIKLIEKNKFYLIILISLFLIMLKPIMVFVLLIPFVLFLINENKYELIKDKKLFLCFFFISLWFLKNILISSCIVFPINQTCLDNLQYSNSEIVSNTSTEAEAWAKGYPDSKIKNGYTEYNSKFNWLETWSNNHLKKIIEKILPLIILILILLPKYFFNNSHFKFYKYGKDFSDKKYSYLIYFLIFYNIIWFLKFPVYRFGMAFISSLIIIFFVHTFVNNKKKLYNKKILSAFLIIGFFLFYIKNINRIINKLDQEYVNAPWPAIYSMKISEKNKNKSFKKVFNENNEFLYFYSSGEECMFSESPCSNFENKNLKKNVINGYVIYYY